MCGRYYRIGDKQAIAEYFSAEVAEVLPDFSSSYNIAPSTIQSVIRRGLDTGARELVGMRWGLVGFGSSGPDPKRSCKWLLKSVRVTAIHNSSGALCPRLSGRCRRSFVCSRI